MKEINIIAKTLLGILALSAYGTLQAETVSKWTIDCDGKRESYHMHDSGKAYFSGNQLVLDTIGQGVVAQYKLADITKITFATVDLSTTGVERELSIVPSLNLSPNPAKDYITIVSDSEAVSAYVIYSVRGESVAKGEAKNGSKVDVSQLPAGVYLLAWNGVIMKFSKL